MLAERDGITMSDAPIDIGHGVTIEISVEEGTATGLHYSHACDAGMRMRDWIPFSGRMWDTGYSWTVEQDDPITISPSLLCPTCKHHGFIRGGRWVPA